MTTVRTNVGADRLGDEVILMARILLIILFIVFGWGQLTYYAGAVSEIAQTGRPMPAIATVVAIVVETFVALAVTVAEPLAPFSNTNRWFAAVDVRPAAGGRAQSERTTSSRR